MAAPVLAQKSQKTKASGWKFKRKDMVGATGFEPGQAEKA